MNSTTPPATEPAPSAPGAVNPSALTIEQLIRLLSAAGAKLASDETIRRHIQAGAPTAADGRMNLMHYMAWLVQQVSSA
ncbi:MAG: hypothetical protein NT167_21460, partial [Verrucomicrobia bacterium]|nr:hypothetical protein [Verrucomicrobiota bacterium]